MGFFKKIIDGLKKTQQNIGFQIKKLYLQATWVRKPRRKLLTI